MYPVAQGVKVDKLNEGFKIECDMDVLDKDVKIKDQPHGFKMDIKNKPTRIQSDKLSINLQEDNIHIETPETSQKMNINISGGFKEISMLMKDRGFSITNEHKEKLQIHQKNNKLIASVVFKSFVG